MTQAEDIEIRRLSSCSFADANQVWNEGFQGYFVDMTISLDAYLARLQREEISVDLSLVAFVGDRPAGFLLNGFRQIRGKKVAWNGGTGVVPAFRRTGVGKALVRAALDLYRDLVVDVACLEAISTNEKAISLYRQFGYEVVDRLVSLKHEGKLDVTESAAAPAAFTVSELPPWSVNQIEFYAPLVPWQSQWQSVARYGYGGEALIMTDAAKVAVGYALFHRKCDLDGAPNNIVLYQCVADSSRGDQEIIVDGLLRHVYLPFDLDCRRRTYNLGAASQIALTVLRDWGFTDHVEQLHMVKRLRPDRK